MVTFVIKKTFIIMVALLTVFSKSTMASQCDNIIKPDTVNVWGSNICKGCNIMAKYKFTSKNECREETSSGCSGSSGRVTSVQQLQQK